jgi:chromate transporter
LSKYEYSWLSAREFKPGREFVSAGSCNLLSAGCDLVDTKKLIKLFSVFFKIGAVTFGGGYAILPVIQREVVDKNSWLTEEEVLDIFAISQSIPGVISINSAIYIGKKVAGIPGAVFSALGMILPSFIVILAIASLIMNLKDNEIVDRFFTGIRASASALILLAAIKMSKTAIREKWGIAVAVVSFILVVFLDVHAIWVIIGGAVCGIAYGLFEKRKRSCK